MMEFRRDDKMSIYLSFEKGDLETLVDVLKSIQEGGSRQIDAHFDRSIITMKKSSPTENSSLLMCKGDSTELYSDSDSLIWKLADEDIDCLKAIFLRCMNHDYLEVAELIRVQTPKNNRVDYLYGDFITTTDRSSE